MEADSLFELLERQIVPLFYDRWQGPVPRKWVQRVKRSLITLGPFVTAARMVRDYTEQLYEPTAAQGDELGAGRLTPPAATLAAWKAQVEAAWPGVHVDRVDVDDAVADLGTERTVDAVVSLGDLTPDDVQVQLLHGPAGQGDELTDPQVVVARPGRPGRRRSPPLPGHLRLRHGRSLRRHRAHRPQPPRPRHARRARPHRLGVGSRRPPAAAPRAGRSGLRPRSGVLGGGAPCGARAGETPAPPAAAPGGASLLLLVCRSSRARPGATCR